MMVLTKKLTARAGELFESISAVLSAPLVLSVSVFALVCVGLLMIYSSSSIVSMLSKDSDYSATYYLVRQLLYVAIGLAIAIVAARTDYHFWAGKALPVIWVASLLLLILVFTAVAGREAYGASRWISLGGFNLQPSEFAKVTIVLTAANIAARFYEEQSIDFSTFLKLMAAGVLVPVVLIFFQPDKGTTIICASTLLVMAYLAGFPTRLIKILLFIGAIGVILISCKDAYSRARVATVFNPFNDPYGDGYQLVQGLYAFASGGLFGMGVGMSHQKYFYLPMSHNDFIFAVIGEELGFVGTVAVLIAFLLIVWAGLQIARSAPDLLGKLIAAGCTSMIFIQLLVNVGGVLCIIPLSGKPLPFISYGGSSVMSCLLLVGFVASVSLHSGTVTESAYAPHRRATDGLVSDRLGEFSLVGEPTLRSARRSSATSSSASDVSSRTLRPPRIDLGLSTRRLRPAPDASQPPRMGDVSVEGLRASRSFNETHRSGRVTTDKSGRRRIDLGPDAADRLRSSRR